MHLLPMNTVFLKHILFIFYSAPLVFMTFIYKDKLIFTGKDNKANIEQGGE